MDDFQKSCYEEAISRGYDDEAAKQIVARVRRPEAPVAQASNSANLQSLPEQANG